MIQDGWRHSLASNSISEQLLFTRDLPGISDQHRLDLSENIPEALASSAFMKSEYGSARQRRSYELFEIGAHLPLGSESDSRRRQDRATGFGEIGADFGPIFESDLRRILDRSRKDPWDRLRIHEGGTLPIMNHDPLYAISGERPQSSSDYYTTAANVIRDLSDTQEVGIKLGAAILTDSAHSTFPLQQSFFSPKSLVA